MPGDGNEQSPASKAISDTKDIKTVLEDTAAGAGAAAAYKMFEQTVKDAKFTGNDASAYFQTMSQSKDLLPSMTIEYMNDRAPKNAAGEIVKKDIDAKFDELLKNSSDPRSAIDRKRTYLISQVFDKLATAGDKDASSISKEDMAKLRSMSPADLRKFMVPTPKRNP